jgi:hypothetical protein
VTRAALTAFLVLFAGIAAGQQPGAATFDHDAHLKKVPGSEACIACHHTRDARDIIQLERCSLCHRAEGDPGNPKGKSFDEMYTKRAFHDQCIGCHLSSAKGPVACAECHRAAIGRLP